MSLVHGPVAFSIDRRACAYSLDSGDCSRMFATRRPFTSTHMDSTMLRMELTKKDFTRQFELCVSIDK